MAGDAIMDDIVVAASILWWWSLRFDDMVMCMCNDCVLTEGYNFAAFFPLSRVLSLSLSLVFS